MTENQKRICSETLEELKILCKENNHFYTPIDVYYKPSGKSLKKVVLLECNEHDCKPFEQDVQDVEIFRRSKKYPPCLSIIQSGNNRIPVPELNTRIKNYKNSVIRDKQIVIRYEDHLHNEKTVWFW
ncbi:hypothetical protein [Chryseobacterium gambrini]|uniref:hypothetical protein n=1 Tax=Chryseobacterium gambrini TaxID=373672 RepID=UPI003BA80EF5